MSESTDAIRANIERTRADLGMDVDALADKVNPSKIVDRQADKVRGAFTSVREKIMGAVDDAGSSVGAAGESAADGLAAGKAKVEGNPLAVGLIAFGVGLLAATLVPASSSEKKLAATAREKAQPLIDEATDVAREMGANLKEPAQDAVAGVTQSATDAVDHLRDDVSTGKDEVTGSVQNARDHISGS